MVDLGEISIWKKQVPFIFIGVGVGALYYDEENFLIYPEMEFLFYFQFEIFHYFSGSQNWISGKRRFKCRQIPFFI